MPTPHWIGATGAGTNSTANWSASKDGTSGAALPTTGDTVYFDKTSASRIYPVVNTSLGAIAKLVFDMPGGVTLSGASTGNAAGTPWAMGGATAEIQVVTATYSANAESYVPLRFSISGGTINKTGPGAIGTDYAAAWSVPINIQEGALFAGAANDLLGTAAITMAAGTEFYNPLPSTAYTYNNPLTINGNVRLAGWSSTPSTSYAGMTLKNTVTLGGAYVVTVGSGTSGSVVITGALRGTAGFTKAGVGELLLHPVTPANNTLTGTLNVTGAAGFAGRLGAGTGAAPVANIDVLPGNGASVPTVNVASSGDWFTVYGAAQTRTVATNFTGAGLIWYIPMGSSTLTFTGDWSGLTATNPADASGVSGVYNTTTTVSYKTLPATLIVGGSSSTGAFSITNNYVGTASPTLRQIVVLNGGLASLAASTFVFNSSGTLPVDLDVGIVPAGTATGSSPLRLGGTTLNNRVSGPVSGSIVSIIKQGTGSWVFANSGNSYGGTTTVSVGTLAVAGTTAGTYLGANSAAATVSVSSAATLELSGGASVTKSAATLTLSGTGDGGNGALRSSSGTNAYSALSYTLSGATTVKVDTGKLTLTGGAITNPSGLTKSGGGVLKLVTGTSGAGTITVSEGTLEWATDTLTPVINVSAGKKLAAYPGTRVTGSATFAAGAELILGPAA